MILIHCVVFTGKKQQIFYFCKVSADVSSWCPVFGCLRNHPPPQSPKMAKPTFRRKTFRLVKWHGFAEADWEDVTLEIVDAKNISKRPSFKAGSPLGETKELRFSMGVLGDTGRKLQNWFNKLMKFQHEFESCESMILIGVFFWKDLWTWLWGYVWHICGFVFGSSCTQRFWRRDVVTDIDWRQITKVEV